VRTPRHQSCAKNYLSSSCSHNPPPDSCSPPPNRCSHNPPPDRCSRNPPSSCSCNPPPSTPQRTPLSAVQLSLNRLATLPGCSQQSTQGKLLNYTPTSIRTTKELHNRSQNLFNQLARSTIKSNRHKHIERQGDGIKLKLEFKLSDICPPTTTSPPTVTCLPAATCPPPCGQQEVFNFYEYEEELMEVVWEHAPVRHCVDPVSKYLDKVNEVNL
jgi:hypothetical protein